MIDGKLYIDTHLVEPSECLNWHKVSKSNSQCFLHMVHGVHHFKYLWNLDTSFILLTSKTLMHKKIWNTYTNMYNLLCTIAIVSIHCSVCAKACMYWSTTLFLLKPNIYFSLQIPFIKPHYGHWVYLGQLACSSPSKILASPQVHCLFKTCLCSLAIHVMIFKII